MRAKRGERTQAEIAPHLGITRAQLANIEGGRSDPGLGVLVKAADYFSCSVDELLGRAARALAPKP